MRLGVLDVEEVGLSEFEVRWGAVVVGATHRAGSAVDLAIRVNEVNEGMNEERRVRRIHKIEDATTWYLMEDATESHPLMSAVRELVDHLVH